MTPRGPHVLALAAAAILAAGLARGAPADAARPPASQEAGVLAPGARGPAVRGLQRELRRRGLRVAVDGSYGPSTRRAVARLQRRLGLRVNGLVDRPLLWWLGLSTCSQPGPTSARGGRRGELRLGAYGPRVCVLQRLLRRAGARVAVDGGYGPRTRTAVRRAQRRLGLPATGVADDRLIARLAAGRRAAPGGAGARRPAPPGALMSVGSEGPRVRGLQAALRRQGFRLAADGVYGPRTLRAVARLQRRLGLPVNGAVDVELLRRIGAPGPQRLEVFPVRAPHSFIDDFGAPRHQGPHEGNDIVAVRGAPVVAVADGAVERLSRVERGLGGIWIRLRADDGTAYYYAHLRSIAPGLVPGTRVRAGRMIGEVGRTGDARGGVYHLHFEMHPAGRPGAVNPYRELRAVDPSSRI